MSFSPACAIKETVAVCPFLQIPTYQTGNMAYQTLAQKYRPGSFSDVVGQQSATRTLINSIKKGRLANAYMFSGPRGIGKTSMARLLSKTLNCEKPVSGDPCGKCDSCREISQGFSIDVLEIDGASNRGIDEIRALRENVKFSPSRGRYKIYIIDEVHMLTTEAFNALLKTLEEPPAHVKFIFATTEPHKVLPTIMSRCQRFDFRKIPPRLIYSRIKDIASSEGIDISDDAALLIARTADGSLRDALVVLDQMISFSSGKIVPEDVIELLGMIHREKIFELAGALIDKLPEKALRITDELISGGKDPSFMNMSLISHFRDLMVVKATGEPSSDMAMPEDEMKILMAQKERISLEEILYILQNLTHAVSLMKLALFARAPFELVLLRMAKRESAMKLGEIMARLEAIEKNGPRDVPSGAGVPAEVMQARQAPERTLKPAARTEKETGLSSFAVPEKPYDVKEAPGPLNEVQAGEDDLEGQKNRWKALLNYIKTRKMSVFVFLGSAHLLEMGGDSLVIGFDRSNSFNKEALETGANKTVLQEAADKVMGRPVRIGFRILENKVPEGQSYAETPGKKESVKEEVNPAIEKAMDIFGGHVVRDFNGG